MAHFQLRSFNKYVTNRLTSHFAAWPRGPFAIIFHVGRSSGKTYETPIMVLKNGDRFVIALTYGAQVDWYRNVPAAGHATLLWHGKTYTLGRPEPLAIQLALPLFPYLERRILQMLHTQEFVSLSDTTAKRDQV
jgi:deazaflavin-dependent oxidoreductase (nitroreductase family)